MANPSKKLSEMVEKWRKRKRGQFVVYTKEGKRFVVPLHYLNHPIFKVLLEVAEEEFGLEVHGPLQLPCEEELMDYILSLLKKNPTEEVEKALVSLTTCQGAFLRSLITFVPKINRSKKPRFHDPVIEKFGPFICSIMMPRQQFL